VEAKERVGDPFPVADAAAGFQEAVSFVLTMNAVWASRVLGVDTLVLCVCATANSRLRELAEERCSAAGITLRVPRPKLCTDNGVMIAALGAHLIAGGAEPSMLTAGTDPGLPVSVSQVCA